MIHRLVPDLGSKDLSLQEDTMRLSPSVSPVFLVPPRNHEGLQELRICRNVQSRRIEVINSSISLEKDKTM